MEAVRWRPALPRLELKAAYVEAVVSAGGIPWIVAPVDDPTLIEEYANRAQGLVISGGAFDIDPAIYGESTRANMGPTKPARTRFEQLLLQRMLALGKPVLGICGGMQLLNVVLGGSLVQDIATEVPGAMPHEQSHDTREPAHVVKVLDSSRLSLIIGASTIDANTTHHQAVRALGLAVHEAEESLLDLEYAIAALRVARDPDLALRIEAATVACFGAAMRR